MNTPDQTSQIHAEWNRQALASYISWSQVAICIFILIAGSISCFSFLEFIFNLNTVWPETQTPTIQAAPWWMGGHLLRGFCTGYIAANFTRYVQAIRSMGEQTEESLLDFMQLHAKVWFRSAAAFAVFFLYTSYYGLVVLPSMRQ